jgi:hypothetical protein
MFPEGWPWRTSGVRELTDRVFLSVEEAVALFELARDQAEI